MMNFTGNSDLRGKQVLVVGMARSGAGAAKLLLGRGANVSLTDSKGEQELTPYLKELKGRAVFYFGGHDSVPVSELDLAVVSPGIPWNSSFLKKLRDSGVRLVSELELSAIHIDAPLIAITGTNGKTTTSSLISEMLKAGGMKVFTGGNIGTPLSECVNSNERADSVVCEVSSFQLEGVVSFHPKVSIILNITEDHLDRHADMKEYSGLKERIYMNQGEGDTLILNADDPSLRNLSVPQGVCVKKFSCREKIENGAWVEGNTLFLSENGETKRICTKSDIPLVGEHNLENVMAAVLAGRASGVEHTDILTAIKNFRSIKHRMEVVGTVDGITFINDSKGTNVGAAEKSIKSFEESVILIAGGKDKGGDYTSLLRTIKEKVKYLVLIGESGGKISALLNGYQRKSVVGTMAEAVSTARAEASSGDIVLLSPACSSFDMFKSYEERGDVFKKAVARLNSRGDNSVDNDA